MLKTRLLTASALVAAAALASPGAALAQAGTTPTANAADPTQAPETANADGTDSASNSEVVVTGSRIRRSTFNSADPVTVISREESTAAGFSSTAEILQSTAVTGGTDQINDTYGGFVINGGPGVNSVALRGLGPQRTLVMLDGRRVSPAGSRGAVGTADLNVLPNAAIDRVEVLNTGASSIYGSDAVAGVINIISRNDVRGVVLEGQQLFTDKGGSETTRLSAVGGFRSGGFKLLGSIEYYERKPLLVGDRTYLSCPRALRGTNGSDFGAGDYIDPRTGQVKCFSNENGGGTVNTIGTPDFTGSTVALAPGIPAGYTGICNRFRPNAAVTAGLLPGFECVGGGSLNINIRDLSSPTFLQEEVINPAKIYTGFVKASYESDVLGGAEFYVSALVNRRKSSQSGQRQFTLDYPVNSPLIPAGLRAALGGRTFLGPQAAPNAPYATGLRVFADYGLYANYQTVDFVRLNGGVRGDLPGGFRYDAFVGQSWSDSRYTSDLILGDRLANSLQVNAAGTACTNAIGGCVAAPVVTPTLIAGRFANTPEVAAWFDYVTDPVTGTTSYKETTAALTIDGPLFALPGGDIQIAVGAEYRKASINDSPASDSVRNNLYGFTSSQPTRGTDSVWEVFGEIELPVIHDSFIYDFTINGSARYTEYKSYGGQETYKIGAGLAPVRGLTFRGSYGTSYRAPALFEQFQGATSGFLALTTDPCNDVATLTNDLIRQQCTADGLPANFRQVNGVTVIGLGGAAAGLQAETSKALTFGAVLEPRFGASFGQLSLAADFFRIKIDNGVAQLSAANVLAQCYANPLRTTCGSGLITREPYTGPGSGRLSVIQSFVNISDSMAKGIDYTFRYVRPMFGGTFRLGAQVTQYLRRYSRTLPTNAVVNTVGTLENPRFSGVFDVNFRKDNVNLRYGVDWIDGTDSYELAGATAADRLVFQLKTPDYFLHTASVRFDFDRFGLTLGVRNVFDKQPPRVTAGVFQLAYGNAPFYSGYDIRGRTFFVNARAGF